MNFNRYVARIRHNSKSIHLGSFKTIDEAEKAVNDFRNKNPTELTSKKGVFGRYICFRKNRERYCVIIRQSTIGEYKTHAEAIAARDEALKIMGIEL